MIQFNISLTKSSKLNSVDWDNIPFGKNFTDHMLVMDFHEGQWQTPEIKEFENLTFSPATSVLHYGQSIFEGMKAYKSEANEVFIFRPELNAKRFVESAERMCMPPIPEELFIACVNKLVDIDCEWIPNKEGFSMYIRPFMIATDEFVGIRPSATYKFIIFLSPASKYYSEPIRVKIEEHYTRATEGGVGRVKNSGNYGSSLYPAKLQQQIGYHQLLWTDSKTHEYVEESGTMNVLFVINGVLVTPSEEKDTILKGTTKRSVIEVAKQWGMPVEERDVTVKEIVEGIKSGAVSEAFGAGTAATVASIATIGFRDEDLNLPVATEDSFTLRVAKHIDNIKYGVIEDENSWLYKVGK